MRKPIVALRKGEYVEGVAPWSASGPGWANSGWRVFIGHVDPRKRRIVCVPNTPAKTFVNAHTLMSLLQAEVALALTGQRVN